MAFNSTSKKFSFSKLLTFALCFVIALFIVFFKGRKTETSGYKTIVCTTFPAYDWVYHIVGDNSSTILCSFTEKNGIDYHFFTPTEYDLKKISECDLLICNGYEDSLWAEEAAKKSGKDIKILNLKRMLINRDGKNEADFESADEHVWLSVKNAQYFVEQIAAEIITLDSENEAVYSANVKRYLNQLDLLDSEYADTFSTEKPYALIIADKNPFTVLFDEYQVNYFSALDDCVALRSTDSKNNGPVPVEEVVGETRINYLTSKMDEYNLKCVYKIEGTTDKLPHSIIYDSKNKLSDVIELDSMHKATLKDVLNGKNYITVMRGNLTEFKKSMNSAD